MSGPVEHSPRVAVVGGGITGLAAALRLTERGATVRLFEASPRLGGVLETETCDGFQIERGSDSFITNRPGAIDLCNRIGFADELIRTNDAFRKTFVVCRGRLRDVPEGFLLMAPSRMASVLTSPVLSPLGKLRLAWEYFVPRKRADADSDESLASFVRRRLGREAFDRLVQPLVGGIYTADAEKLSLRATLPRFLEMERVHGSLIRAARHEARTKPRGEAAEVSGARYSLFVTPRRGLTSLVEAIAGRLAAGCVALNTPVERVARRPDGLWDVALREGAEHFDAVILANPAPVAAKQLAEVDAELASELGRIPYAGAAVVSIGFRREQIGHALDGFGFVVPEIEQRRILACSFSSVKFAGRAPEGHELFRVFVGGARHPEMLNLSDDELQRITREELGELLGVKGPPVVARISRYRGAMPQYHVGHMKLVERIEARTQALAGLELAGNAYRGVGIPDSIQGGEEAAERVLAHTSAPRVEAGR